MLNATIVKRIDLTSELIILGVKPDGGVGDFLPGQYVALGLLGSAPRPDGFPPEKTQSDPDKIIKRAYSIGSAPHQKECLEFYIAIVPDGALTSRLVLPKVGDRIFAAPKITGTFTLESVPSDQSLVLISTGTGLAPYISMLRTPTTWTEGREIAVVHGVRYARDLGYREELEELAAANRQLKYFPVVSRDRDWSGYRGHVQQLFVDKVIDLNPSRDHVFLCGNPAMIEGMEKLLADKGYTEHTRKKPGNLHLEKYW